MKQTATDIIHMMNTSLPKLVEMENHVCQTIYNIIKKYPVHYNSDLSSVITDHSLYFVIQHTRYYYVAIFQITEKNMGNKFSVKAHRDGAGKIKTEIAE